ncbi:putative alpha/Beta hydrolase [Rosa chinensis]|uniref:Putative alpha/Beta hydrolase n=1 Tax=Rosa chinensis TaxID=74649 RepID=A0A2P6Q3X2_ROSCH|nr:putative alpha/Beta hydrolase [Rosa chinensis]
MDLVDSSTPLPPWFIEDDLEAYGKLYEKSGFQTALQLPYRQKVRGRWWSLIGSVQISLHSPVLIAEDGEEQVGTGFGACSGGRFKVLIDIVTSPVVGICKRRRDGFGSTLMLAGLSVQHMSWAGLNGWSSWALIRWWAWFGPDVSWAWVPALIIMGKKNYVYEVPGKKDYIDSDQLKEFVPDLEIVFLPEGTYFVHEQLPDQVNDFVHEQLPNQVNELIVTFLRKHI